MMDPPESCAHARLVRQFISGSVTEFDSLSFASPAGAAPCLMTQYGKLAIAKYVKQFDEDGCSRALTLIEE
jgi:hypothetical protein